MVSTLIHSPYQRIVLYHHRHLLSKTRIDGQSVDGTFAGKKNLVGTHTSLDLLGFDHLCLTSDSGFDAIVWMCKDDVSSCTAFR